MNRMAAFYAAVYEHFDRARFAELTRVFGLDPKKRIASFSKGMRRQAATILALSSKPDYIFFDETFDGLDPVMREVVKKIIYADICDRASTAVITSHSLRELEDTCDRLALLHKGGLVFENDVEHLKTSLFKVQIAFSEAFNQERFTGLDIRHYSQKGRVASMIAGGDRDQAVETLKAMQPVLLDVLPLSLDEVCIYEMDALGYGIKDFLDDGGDAQ